MRVIDAAEVGALLEPRELIEALRRAFQQGCEMPVRHHHNVKVDGAPDATLLLMPAWRSGGKMGLKSVTVYPGNPAAGLPTVMGFYALMDATTGKLLAMMDATTLTAKRTAAASALAASYLAREDAQHLLMAGTGTLPPYIVRAHAVVRPIERVSVFGRTPAKVEALVSDLRSDGFDAAAVLDLAAAVRRADIVSCATTATEPVVRGAWLRPGTHVDLVGAFRPDMREVDEEAVVRSRVYVDSRAGATHEAGDILIPLEKGAIGENHVVAELSELARGEKQGRQSRDEITLFKSVGMALEDLTAAELVYEKLTAEVDFRGEDEVLAHRLP